MIRPQRLRDQAIVLPIATLILLTPPLLRVFGQGGSIGGLPALLVYLFGVWAAAILIGWRLARRLEQVPDGAAVDPPPNMPDG
ncbi:MAG: hypothetical protein AB7O80_17370 [Acetobacteraceae bacterium]